MVNDDTVFCDIIFSEMKEITFAVTNEDIDFHQTLLEHGADEVVYALNGCAFSGLCGVDLDQVQNLDHCSVLCTRLFPQDQLEQLKRLLDAITETEIRHVYFSDPAVVELADEQLKPRLLYRPETLATNALDARWWMEQGIGGVSVSPVLTINEVEDILKKCPDCEVTIHGHLLLSASRRLLLSLYAEEAGLDPQITGHNDLSLKEEKRDYELGIYENGCGTFIYSDFVQESLGDVVKLAADGADRFFIDSIRLSHEETVSALDAYQAVLQGADASRAAQALKDAFAATHYTRGFYGQKTIL